MRNFKTFVLGLLATLPLLLSGCSKAVRPEKSPASLVADARLALKQADFAKVEDLVARIPPGAEEWQAAKLLAGEAATKAGNLTSALRHYVEAAEKDLASQDGLLALFSAAEIHLDRGRLSDAEKLYREVLAAQPGNGLTNERMAFLLSITGRRWESLDHYFVLIRGGDADYKELGLAADVGRPIEQPEFLVKCQELAPEDPLVQLALATQAFDQAESHAKQQLELLVASFPDLIAAQAMLGELLVESASQRHFIQWHQSLPAAADNSPDIWFVRGLWARKQADLNTAASCFWQSIVRVPFHRRAFYLLGQTLVALKDPQADRVTQYSALMIQLSQSIDQVLISDGNNIRATQETTETLLKLGRIWEACAWALSASRRFPQATWPRVILDRHGRELTADLPRLSHAANPATGHPLVGVPQFARLIAEVTARQRDTAVGYSSAGRSPARITFEETSAIPFQYFNADDPKTKGVRSFEQTGGGVAILDFDLDGAPDVYLSQGSEWKTGQSRPTPSSILTDKLFRNVSGQEFRDASAGLVHASTSYGQGCTIGDFDNDGFPDLYVANVGQNRLFRNMGDGTFEDITESAGIMGTLWTVSAMICDLNGDGLPDIFDVNYLTGDDVFEMICNGRACSPSVFPGARDCLLINQGDGRFVEAVDATPAENSKGLGIVAFQTKPAERPMLFIANDQVANHFLLNSPSDNAHNIELLDASLTTGLAFNEDGLPMACMGIAIDDWNGNGLIDLFVTNFHNEPNTLYLQDAPGLFVDATKAMGLKAASIAYTGWGTQSLDADLDGFPDLVLTNGHVDDYTDVGGEYHMRPQFFHNQAGRFQEITDGSAGIWFTQKFLGRGLARVDWDLDGRPEFIVSNINAPVSVLRNVSTNTGHFLRIRLVATSTARDASGTFVTLNYADRQVVKQLTMGDGYMASNERTLDFGLGAADRVESLTIQWPSGTVSVIKTPAVDKMLTVVEGRENGYVMESP